MDYGAKKQLIYHYILQEYKEFKWMISPDGMSEVAKDLTSICERIILHPISTKVALLKGENVEVGYGDKLLPLNTLRHMGEDIGKVCFSRLTGKIYFNCSED